MYCIVNSYISDYYTRYQLWVSNEFDTQRCHHKFHGTSIDGSISYLDLVRLHLLICQTTNNASNILIQSVILYRSILLIVLKRFCCLNSIFYFVSTEGLFLNMFAFWTSWLVRKKCVLVLNRNSWSRYLPSSQPPFIYLVC